MDYKLELHNFAVDGRVTDILEWDSSHTNQLVLTRWIKFNYYNKKLCCMAKVVFETDSPKVNLWEKAVTFVKRLK